MTVIKQKQPTVRVKSSFYKMRLFHNWIKRKIITKYMHNKNVLELGVGKGGDILKWIECGAKLVDGYDKCQESIDEANKRLVNLSNDNTKPIPLIRFHLLDLSSQVLDRNENNEKYHIVSSMFAFHYFFDNNKSVETIMKTIDQNTAVGSYFLACMFDGKKTEKRLETEFTHQDFDITYTLPPHLVHPTKTGTPINVSIKDTVLETATEEYLVYSDDLVDRFNQIDFLLIEAIDFATLYKDWMTLDKNNLLSSMEQEISFLNIFYIFQKQAKKDKQVEQ